MGKTLLLRIIDAWPSLPPHIRDSRRSSVTGVTGFNDLSAAQANAEAETVLAVVGVTSTVTGRIDVATSTRASQSSANTISEKIDDPNGGRLVPVSQVPVPMERTVVLKHTPDGLRGEVPLHRVVGDRCA
jgi:hypothetical protein